MSAMRDRFPVTDAAFDALVQFDIYASDVEVRKGLAAAAPHQVQAWVDALTDSDILTLRFGNGPRFCDQLRAELRRLAGRPA